MLRSTLLCTMLVLIVSRALLRTTYGLFSINANVFRKHAHLTSNAAQQESETLQLVLRHCHSLFLKHQVGPSWVHPESSGLRKVGTDLEHVTERFSRNQQHKHSDLEDSSLTN